MATQTDATATKPAPARPGVTTKSGDTRRNPPRPTHGRVEDRGGGRFALGMLTLSMLGIVLALLGQVR